MPLGYPGVNGPDAPKKDDRVQGTVIGSDAVNSLVQTSEGLVLVDNKSGKRTGDKR